MLSRGRPMRLELDLKRLFLHVFFETEQAASLPAERTQPTASQLRPCRRFSP